MIILYILIILATSLQSASTKLFNRQSDKSATFNAIKSITSFFMFLLAACFGFTLHVPTVLFGLLYGAGMCLSMYSGYRALCLGPMALTSMLVSFSVVIPLVWGVTFGGEKLKLLQYPALFILVLAILLTNADKFKSKDTQSKGSGLWLLFVFLTFAVNGVCSILQKQHQTLYPESYSIEFSLFSMLLCAVVFSTVALIKTPLQTLREVKGKRYGVLSGVTNGIAGFLTLTLAGLENASVLFPVISAGTILASLACGRIIFKERLKPNHYAALAAGITAVVLLKL